MVRSSRPDDMTVASNADLPPRGSLGDTYTQRAIEMLQNLQRHRQQQIRESNIGNRHNPEQFDSNSSHSAQHQPPPNHQDDPANQPPQNPEAPGPVRRGNRRRRRRRPAVLIRESPRQSSRSALWNRRYMPITGDISRFDRISDLLLSNGFERRSDLLSLFKNKSVPRVYHEDVVRRLRDYQQVYLSEECIRAVDRRSAYLLMADLSYLCSSRPHKLNRPTQYASQKALKRCQKRLRTRVNLHELQAPESQLQLRALNDAIKRLNRHERRNRHDRYALSRSESEASSEDEPPENANGEQGEVDIQNELGDCTVQTPFYQDQENVYGWDPCMQADVVLIIKRAWSEENRREFPRRVCLRKALCMLLRALINLVFQWYQPSTDPLLWHYLKEISDCCSLTVRQSRYWKPPFEPVRVPAAMGQ